MTDQPIIGEKYHWNNSEVKVLNVRYNYKMAKQFKDGSVYSGNTTYDVEIEDVTPNGRFLGTKIWTPFTAAGFDLIK